MIVYDCDPNYNAEHKPAKGHPNRKPQVSTGLLGFECHIHSKINMDSSSSCDIWYSVDSTNENQDRYDEYTQEFIDDIKSHMVTQRQTRAPVFTVQHLSGSHYLNTFNYIVLCRRPWTFNISRMSTLVPSQKADTAPPYTSTSHYTTFQSGRPLLLYKPAMPASAPARMTGFTPAPTRRGLAGWPKLFDHRQNN